jgi:hypothetical protein
VFVATREVRCTKILNKLAEIHLTLDLLRVEKLAHGFFLNPLVLNKSRFKMDPSYPGSRVR